MGMQIVKARELTDAYYFEVLLDETKSTDKNYYAFLRFPKEPAGVDKTAYLTRVRNVLRQSCLRQLAILQADPSTAPALPIEGQSL